MKILSKAILVLIIVLLWGIKSQSFAEVILDKGKVKLSVKPGETVNGTITLSNSSATDIPLRAYFEDFVYVPPFDGSKKFLPVGSTEYSCGRWVSFSPQEFILPALSKQEINYVIKVPQGALGGYYGVLFFEKSPKLAPQQVGLGIVVRVGCLFFLETEDKVKKGALEDMSVEGNSIKGNFLNSGNTILVASAVYYIMDEQGMAIDRAETGKFYLPPKNKFPLKIPIPEKLPSGKYTVIWTFDLEEGDAQVKEIEFLKDQTGNSRILQIRD